jgi:hypothetical protein
MTATYTRYKHIITSHDLIKKVVSEATDDKPAVTKKETVTDAKVFPSVNQAKRYNRTKLDGVAKVVTRRPKNGAVHAQNNAYCKKED